MKPNHTNMAQHEKEKKPFEIKQFYEKLDEKNRALLFKKIGKKLMEWKHDHHDKKNKK
jgi:hypothetical protein